MAITMVPVTGQYRDSQKRPLYGYVTFRPRAATRVDQGALTTYIGREVTVRLDSEGSFSVDLPATDDQDLTPSDFTYEVTEDIEHGRTYDINVPAATQGSLDLSEVAPTAPVEPSNDPVTRTEFNALHDDVDTLEAGQGPGGHEHDAADITSGQLDDNRIPWRLGVGAQGVADWNGVAKNGWFRTDAGAGKNAPNDTDDFLGMSWLGLWPNAVQRVVNLTTYEEFRRYRDSNADWQPWVKVLTSTDYNDLSNTPALATVATSGDYTDLSNTPALATVATSGDYTDLSNTPALASVATSGAYSDLTGKPDVQLSLGFKRPEDYGTITGTDDESTLAALKADLVDGDVIYLSPGVTYATGSTGFRITGINDLTVIANGAKWERPNSTIGSTKSPFMVEDCTNLRIYGLDSAMPNASTRQPGFAGIRLENVTNFVVRDCIVRTPEGAGIFIYNCHDGSVLANRVDASYADGVHITNGSTGIEVAYNKLLDTGDDAIAVVSYADDPAGRCADIRAHDNVIRRSGARGMTIAGGKNVRYHDNTVDTTSSAGIYVFQEQSWDIQDVDDCAIFGNFVINANTTGGATHAGIFLGGNTPTRHVRNVRVEGNTVLSSGREGIECRTDTGDGVMVALAFINNYVETTSTAAASDDDGMKLYDIKDVEVRGNRVVKVAGSGILVVNCKGNNARVQDNHVEDCNQSGTTQDGIRCHGDSGDHPLFIVTGNSVANPSANLDWELQTHELDGQSHIIANNAAN